MNEAPEKLLTMEAVAEQLGVSPRTVEKWHQDKKISGVKVGERLVRFYLSVVKREVLAKKNQS